MFSGHIVSYWPVGQTTRRFGIQSHIFATNPWAIIRAGIARRGLSPGTQSLASALIAQAEDFFKASLAVEIPSTRPLLIYYCFLNLVKALALFRGVRTSYANALHGLSERLKPNGKELIDAYLEAYPSSATAENVYSDFLETLTGQALSAVTKYEIPQILPQVLQGHRIWCECADKEERFISVEQIVIVHNAQTKKLWLRVWLLAEDLSRFGYSHAKCLSFSGLGGSFREVRVPNHRSSRKMICFEETTVRSYTGRPTDIVMDVVSGIRPYLWANVLSASPYRRYYLYLCPPAEVRQRCPQLASLYLLFYYLGSITRYRPHHFDDIMTGPFAAQIEEFIQNIPMQFIYLMAGEFAEQEVTKAAIV